MDIKRTDMRRRKITRWAVWGGLLLVGTPLCIWGVSRMKPAAAPVERSTVWIDSVKRGPMVRNVRGTGTLIPEDVLWIPAVTDGRVTRIVIRPGAIVKPDSIILEMDNPELDSATIDAEWQVKAAEANYRDLKAKLETQKLDQQAKAQQVHTDFIKAKMQSDRDTELLKNGLTADIVAKQSVATAEELEHRANIEKQNIPILAESGEAQLASQQVGIEKLRAAWELKKRQRDQLRVRAGVEGVLQQITIEVGQRVVAGAQLAKVADPKRLKAELHIAETQAKDLTLGQKAEIDTRNGVIPGRVMRIDPAVLNGTRTVDVRLEAALPPGAVPDLSVDGTIELDRLNNVLYVGRPVASQENGTITLFRLEPDGKEATRVPVKLGRVSVNTVEIVDGLKVGDQVVLSDMSTWDDRNRIRLN